jgi:C4-dicarboxylate-binding protein DctP
MRAIAAFFAVLLTLAPGSVPAEAKKILRLTMQLPLKSVPGKNILKFKDGVEKATGGSIEIQVFDSAQLYDDKNGAEAVGAGNIDMGIVALSRFGNAIPAVDVFQIPFLFDSDAKLRAAVAPNSTVRGPLDEAIGRSGARVLWWQAYGGTVLLTKGGQPVKTPAELKGRKVRILSNLLGTWVKANGGIPVNVIGGDQYFAYQRGAIDVGMTSPASITTRKIWEVMDTVTITNMAANEYVVVINDKIFRELSEAERAAILAAADSAEAQLRDAFPQIEREALEAGRQNKMTIYAPNAAELSAFRKSAEPVREEFLQGAGELGKQVLDAALALK